jgi:hypothetical protein
MTTEEPMAQANVGRWQGHLETAARAGMSIAQYAREHGLSAQTLYAARHAMSKRARKRIAAPGAAPSPGFVPVRLAGASAGWPNAKWPSAGLVARLPNGTELCFGALDEANLGAVLRELAGLACSR